MSLIDRIFGRELSKISPTNLPQGAQLLPLPVTQLNIPQIAPTGGSQNISDIVSGYWFSALQPTKPMAPEGQRVRGYEIQPGANIVWTPKSEAEGQGVSFRVLREFATWDLIRLVIETVKDRLSGCEWEFRAIRKKGEKFSDYKDRSNDDKRLDQLTKFFSYPDGEHCWADWIRPLIEDMLVIDAASILMERDVKKRIANLRVIDGATIGRMMTDQGFTPPAPQVAYQQVLYGLPSFNLTVNDLLYAMRNPRTNRRYGLSPVEQVMVTIAIGLNRQKFLLDYYVSGNMPEALCFLPQDVPITRVREVQEWFDSVLAGDLAQRRRLTFLPGYGSGKDNTRPNVIFPKEVLLKDPLDEWLWQTCCYSVGVSPQAMLRMMNRATSQEASDVSAEEGLLPKQKWIVSVINNIVQRQFRYDDVEFAYKATREVDVEKQSNIDKTYISIGVHTINQVKERLGEDPFPYPEADEPGVLTPTGFVPLTGGNVAGQPGAVGSAQGPAAKEMVGNQQDFQDQQDQKQQEQGDQAHQRALELQANKPTPAGPPGKPGAGKPKPKNKIAKSESEARDEHGRWTSGGGTPPGKPPMAHHRLLFNQPHIEHPEEFPSVQENHERSDRERQLYDVATAWLTERMKKGACSAHNEYTEACFDCAVNELARLEEEYELVT